MSSLGNELLEGNRETGPGEGAGGSLSNSEEMSILKALEGFRASMKDMMKEESGVMAKWWGGQVG